MTNLISNHIYSNSTRTTYKVLIRNENSHTTFSKPDLISIKEFKEDGLSLEIPINICQKGHNLTVFLINSDLEIIPAIPDVGHIKEAKFEAVAKVVNFEKNMEHDNLICIDVQFTQYDTYSWKNILKEYKKYQEEITNILMRQHNILDEE
jgi:hypothetical protein